MNSIRERILQALTSRLAPIAQGEGAQILRSPTTAVTREASPALLIFPETESIAQRANDRIERHLVVRLVALGRATESEPAEMIETRSMMSRVSRTLWSVIKTPMPWLDR